MCVCVTNKSSNSISYEVQQVTITQPNLLLKCMKPQWNECVCAYVCMHIINKYIMGMNSHKQDYLRNENTSNSDPKPT